MPIRAFAAGNDGLSGFAPTCPIVVPSTAVAGDVALAVLSVSNTGNVTAPGGWTLVSGPDNNQNNLVTRLYSRTLISGDIGATFTWTAATSGRFLGAMMVVSTATLTGLLVGGPTLDTTADVTLVPPPVTTAATPAAWEIVSFWALRATASTAATVTVPATHTKDGEAATNTGTSPNWTVGASHRTGGAVASTQYGTTSGTSSASVTDNLYTIAVAGTSVSPTVPAATATARATAFAGTGPSIDASPPSATALASAKASAPGPLFASATVLSAFGGKYVRQGPSGGLPLPGTPSAPTAVRASMSGTTVTVTWGTPTSDGGAPITGYTAINTTTGTTQNLGVVLTTTFTGLTAGAPYRFSVAAVNSAGTGAAGLASISGSSSSRFPGDPRPLVTGKFYWGIDENDKNPEVIDPNPQEFGAPEVLSGGVRAACMRFYYQTTSDVTPSGGGAIGDILASLNKGRLPWISIQYGTWAPQSDGRNTTGWDAFINWVETVPAGPVWATLGHEPDAASKVPDKGSYADWYNMCKAFRARMDAYEVAHGGLGVYKWKNLAFAPILTAQGYANGEIDLFFPDPLTNKRVFDFVAVDPYVTTHTSPGFTANFAKAAAWAKKYGYALGVGEYAIMNDDPSGAQKMQDVYETLLNGSNDVINLNYFNSGILNNSQAAFWPLKDTTTNGNMLSRYVSLLKDPRSTHFWDGSAAPDGTRYPKPAGA